MQERDILKDGSIYHYTSLEGLKGIIEGNALWLTHYKFLNDPNELVYYKKYDENNMIKAIFDKISAQLIPMIMSFSEDSDSYSLWSNYTNHYGFNIEFDIKKLRKNFRSFQEVQKDEWARAFMEGRINYSTEQQEKIKNKESDNISEILKANINDLIVEKPELRNMKDDERIAMIHRDMAEKTPGRWTSFFRKIGNYFSQNVFLNQPCLTLKKNIDYVFKLITFYFLIKFIFVKKRNY